MKIAFQGEHGAYSEEAARSFAVSPETLPCTQFSEVFEAVVGGSADAGMVPVENSEAGTVAGNYALLQANPLFVVGEQVLRVRHCLLARRGERLETIRRVRSHPQALMQCEAFLRAHRLEPLAAYDTAGAAKMLAESEVAQGAGEAAIASALAGELYGLERLVEGIESNPHNYTRFLVVARTPAPRSAQSKSSIVLGTANVPGALYRALGAFASRGLNVTKLESSPSRRGPWEYFFFVDFEGHQEDEGVRAALAELSDVTTFVRILGSYPPAPLQEE